MMGAFKRAVGKAPWRAFAAWFLACYVAGMLLSAGFGIATMITDVEVSEIGVTAIIAAPLFGAYLGLFVALLTALPMLVLTSLIRGVRAGRPWADILVGGLMGAVLVQVFAGGTMFSLGQAPMRGVDLALTLGFALAGAISGWVYWHVAGRPRPHDPLPQKIVQDHVFD